MREAHERANSQAESLRFGERAVPPDTNACVWAKGFDDRVVAHAATASFAEVAIANVDGGMVPAGVVGSIVQFELRAYNLLSYQAAA